MGWEYDLETDIRYLQGVEKGKIDVIESLLKQTNFSIEKIASIADVSIEFVEKIKNDIS
jgi:DNA-dependent RNA polymerase auxiliary subunit epsilon